MSGARALGRRVVDAFALAPYVLLGVALLVAAVVQTAIDLMRVGLAVYDLDRDPGALPEEPLEPVWGG